MAVISGKEALIYTYDGAWRKRTPRARPLTCASDMAARSAWRERVGVGLFSVLLTLACLLALLGRVGHASDDPIEWPLPGPEHAVQITAANPAQSWRTGSYEVFLFPQGCRVQQANTIVEGTAAVLWFDRGEPLANRPHKIIAYFENASRQDEETGQAAQSLASRTWLGRFHTNREFGLSAEIQTVAADATEDGRARPQLRGPDLGLYERATAARQPTPAFPVRPAQWTQTVPPRSAPAIPQPTAPLPAPQQVPPNPLQPMPQFVPPQAAIPPTLPPFQTTPARSRRIRFGPRSSIAPQIQLQPSPDGLENIIIVTNGLNVIIDGVDALGTVDISADRVVIWTQGGLSGLNLSGATETGDQPLELYLEGNIEFRQADRVIQANSMYYNVPQENGVVLSAEMLTSVPNYEGLVRLKADVLRQVDRSNFEAHGAAFTTSRLGVPGYWFQAGDMTFQEREIPRIDPFTDQVVVDPYTGQPIADRQRLATSRNNLFYVGGVPVFYWPSFKTDFSQPGLVVDSIKIGSDNVFGTQVRVDVNLFQLFGIENRLPNTEWIGSVDYLSKRGWGIGTSYVYDVDRFLTIPGPARGLFDAWGIGEQGLDNLGADRPMLVPEADNRGRVLWQHQQYLTSGWQVDAEVGWISDRNFLEQYYELEWDQWKDQITGVQFKRLLGNGSWNIEADVRVNDFFTQTNWLRLDQFQLGQSLLNDRLTWLSHSHVGYGQLEIATVPEDPVDAAKFNRLPWEVNSEGVRIGTRNEIDLPIQLGPTKFVPFALGDITYWGEDINGDEITRLFGQAGFRWSMPMWRVDPTVQNELFNLSGLAHKVVFQTEFLFAEADKNLDQFPLYDRLDDNAVIHFRRRFTDDTFGGAIPLPFDERFYALRTGMQQWVTAPVPEIADDLMTLQFGAYQRWQTKRGVLGNQRIVDWITLDTEATYFPKGDRDNFGEDIGLFNYGFRWHVGDRLTLVSDGYADTFADGLRRFTLGGYISRPERGSLFLGFRSLEGPISSNVVVGSFAYRMTPKWLATAGTVYDFGSAGNIGQQFELTRVGESFLISFGVNVDTSRDNVGAGFAIEPRFLPFTRRGLIGGVQIPPAGDAAWSNRRKRCDLLRCAVLNRQGQRSEAFFCRPTMVTRRVSEG